MQSKKLLFIKGGNKMRLENKVALITGGGTGIGAATARIMAQEGAFVAVTGRRPEPLNDVVKSIESFGGRAAAKWELCRSSRWAILLLSLPKMQTENTRQLEEPRWL